MEGLQMKKFWFRLVVELITLVGIAWLNNAVLLHFHPLEYYYTPSGILLTAVTMTAEAVILWPLTIHYLQRWVLQGLEEGVSEKESIETEFKED
jgi:hypothetical protein